MAAEPGTSPVGQAAMACATSHEDTGSEVTSSDKVDYEHAIEDLAFTEPLQPFAPGVPSPDHEVSNQVQTSDPYCFD